MPEIKPKIRPSGAPSKNLTPQQMRAAVAELKNKRLAPSMPRNPDDSPVGARPDNTRPAGFVEEATPQMLQAAPPMTRQTQTPTMRPPMSPPMRPIGSGQLMKKGGTVKTYASGGSARGAGIAQRGVRKCKVY